MKLKRFICALLLVCMAVAVMPVFPMEALAASPYYITVDLTNQIVTVYDNGNVTDEGIVRQMICSSGRPGMGTPKGTFTLPKKSRAAERTEWYYFASSHCYAKWATRIRGGILFHSILFNSKKGKPTAVSVNALGTKASHGCVRLKIEDAHWIAMNCPAGTRVKIFDGKKNKSLHKKILKKTFSRDAQTYDSYLGRLPKDPNVLGKGRKGENVGKLQARLKALGYYGGKVDDSFGASTETALKNFQAACGVGKTGIVNITEAFWSRIFADDAPTGTYITLTQGMNGPAVQALEQALKDCKVLDGNADAGYDAATVAAVKKYQACFGFKADGKAAPSLQKDAISRAASLKKRFGGKEYKLVEQTNPIVMGKVKPKTLYMRKKASTRAKSVKKLKKNKRVRVLSMSKKWAKVKYGGKTGYVQKKYLRLYNSTETVYAYEAVAADPSPTPFIPTPAPTAFIPTPSPTAAIAAPELKPEPEATPTPAPTAEPVPATTPTPAPTAEPAPAATPAPAPEPKAEPAQAAEAPAVDLRGKYAVALRDGVGLYADAKAEDEIAVMSAGAALEAVAVAGGWVTVRFDGRTLCVLAENVELIDALPEAENAPESEPAAATEPQPEPEAEAPAGESGLTIEYDDVPEQEAESEVGIDLAVGPDE